MKKQTILQLLFIGLGVGVILLAVWFSVKPGNRAQTPPPQPLASEEETFPEIPRVALGEAFSALTAKYAVFIDIRDSASYKEAHVAGASHFPWFSWKAK